MTKNDFEKLWFRDNASMMNKPSIDRKNSDEDYTLDNCQFVEMVKNITKDCSKPINQYDLDGNFIKSYSSIAKAARSLNLWASCISQCCNHKGYYKTTGGFIWKHANSLKTKGDKNGMVR